MLMLRPAIKYQGKVYKGEADDSHTTLGERLDIPHPESSRGFSPDGKLFLSRKQAIGWLQRYFPKVYKKLKDIPAEGLHSENLANALGIQQKPHETEQSEFESSEASDTRRNKEALPNKETVDLSDKTAIVYDRGGLYLYCAEKLAEKYKKVMYYLADSDAYPSSQKATIGAGLPKIKRIHDFYRHLDEADVVYFFDCYDGELQHWLRSKGYTVFGSGRGEQVEIDKIKFLELLEEKELPCPQTYLAEGMDDLCEYLKKHDGETLFLKNLHRGDFESRKFTSMAQSRPFLNDLKKRLGSASDTIEVLVQHKIDSECEAGYDGFQVDGQFTDNAIAGYEIKDKGFVGKVLEDTPDILKDMNDAFSDTFKKLGYRGNYSTELRITKDGIPYYIDATCRVPSPPGELMCEIYENWSEATYQIACGEVPCLEPKAIFGAEIVLTSGWHGEHEIHVKFPNKYKQHIKLKNHTIRDGEYYCIPNGNGEFFGAVVAWGDTLDEAIKKVLEIAETVEADELEYDATIFDKAKETIKSGEKFGINY